MKKIMIASAAVLAALTPMTAYAAPPQIHQAQIHQAKAHKAKTVDTVKIGKEEFTSGVVTAYAADTRMLKLDAGQQFKLAPSVTNASYKIGDKVTVRWTMKDGARIADSVNIK